MKPAAELYKRMGVSLAVIQKSEAKILGMRWGVKWQPVLVWMKAKEFYAANDFWEFST
jgi:hypothetical protein